MELDAAIRRRRMVRSFSETPVPDELLARLLAVTARAPAAGNTNGVAWIVLSGPEQTSLYWQHTTTDAWRRRSRRWPGLSRAPVIALSLCSPPAYVLRYSEPDKASSGLGVTENGGGGEAAWSVPYWFGDAAFATMLVLLTVVDAGLSACFLGNFRGERQLLEALSVPRSWRLFGAVLIGHPGGDDPRSASLDRLGPRTATIHWGRWGSTR